MNHNAMKYFHTIFFLFLALLFSIPATAQKLQVYDLTCEHKINPLGISTTEPRLSWKINSERRGVVQSAYEIRVSASTSFSSRNLVWESGKIEASTSVLVPYAGTGLTSGNRYYWQVRVWDNQGKRSSWSDIAWWEMGLLSPGDWQAQWIEPSQEEEPDAPAYYLRKEFQANASVAKARLYISSLGFYEAYLNGRKIGDEVLTPGWTSYHNRIQYQIYDVTEQLRAGSNALGAVLGNGWYRGHLGWKDNWGVYGKRVALLCQLEITYSDGSRDVVSSDDSWKATSDGPIRMNSIYNGETYDARMEMTGWASAGFNDNAWEPVERKDHARDVLVVTQTVPVRAIQEIKPKDVFTTPSGTLVVDMGQNMVGWVKIRIENGAEGDTFRIRHAEVLDKYGEFYTENLRSAQAELTYVKKGDGAEIYEPRFTFMGFRYVALEGFTDFTPDQITGVVVHSDMTPTGSFTCSNELVNQLQHNIQWGQKGNFVDVPTDCPQRDERMGWTGDAQAFIRTAAFNMDVAAFFTKWLQDMKADQQEAGGIPHVIPDVLGGKSTSAGWADVVTIAPTTIYEVYQDRRILEIMYPAMEKYIAYIQSKAGETHIWKGGSVFGDWLFYKPELRQWTVPDGHTDQDMIATLFYAHSVHLTAKAAEILGYEDEASDYYTLEQQIKNAFNEEYVTGSGRIFSNSQTGYVLALMFDMLPEELEAQAASYLVENIRGRDNHLSTGFLGTPYINHVLTEHGYTQVAYDLLLQESFPSWLYPVTMGATTIWERWDGIKTDSTFQNAGMNSFNHYAYGAIGDWMYRVVAGINPASPGYKEILISPQVDPRLTFAEAKFKSSYGDIVSGWTLEDGVMQLTVTIPANTTARILLPGKPDPDQVSLDGSPVSTSEEVQIIDGEHLSVGSGTYTFSWLKQE